MDEICLDFDFYADRGVFRVLSIHPIKNKS